MGSGEGTDVLHDYRYQEFSITLIERGYTTKLPSKTDHPPLPTNSTGRLLVVLAMFLNNGSP